MKVRHPYHQTRICNSWVAIIEQYVQIKLVTMPRHGSKFTYLTGDACVVHPSELDTWGRV